MKIGILVLSVGSFGKKGYYNLQEIGLAKALDSLCEEIRVYKLVPSEADSDEQLIEGTHNAVIQYLPARHIGTNGIPNMKFLDRKMDVLICFSDIQIALPRVFRWAKKNQIIFLPYIGVVESHSTSRIKKHIMTILYQKNLGIYRKCKCLAKTPAVMERLQETKVKNITVVPVCLDQSLVNESYKNNSKQKMKEKYGYQVDDKVLLFVGRLIEEKQPLRAVDILDEIRKNDQTYKLLIVGSGPLKKMIQEKVQKLKLDEHIKIVECIPNTDMWEVYRLSETYINLNQQEIFGMAILEAMYYECKVVAWKAPGPNLIIENGVSGWLVNTNDEMIEKIRNVNYMGDEAHKRIANNFTWESSAKKIISIAGG